MICLQLLTIEKKKKTTPSAPRANSCEDRVEDQPQEELVYCLPFLFLDLLSLVSAGDYIEFTLWIYVMCKQSDSSVNIGFSSVSRPTCPLQMDTSAPEMEPGARVCIDKGDSGRNNPFY